MNGAVHGDATTAASTPSAKERAWPLSLPVAPPRLSSLTPISKTPKRFSASSEKNESEHSDDGGTLQARDYA
jgi:hypothetical protein